MHDFHYEPVERLSTQDHRCTFTLISQKKKNHHNLTAKGKLVKKKCGKKRKMCGWMLVCMCPSKSLVTINTSTPVACQSFLSCCNQRLQTNTLEDNKHTTSGLSMCVHSHASIHTICSKTSTSTALFTHTGFLCLSEYWGVYVTGLMAHWLKSCSWIFFSPSPSAVRLLISFKSYFKGVLLKPVS